MLVRNEYSDESCEAAAAVAPSVGIIQRVANDLDTLRSILKTSTYVSIPVCKHLYLRKFTFFCNFSRTNITCSCKTCHIKDRV